MDWIKLVQPDVGPEAVDLVREVFDSGMLVEGKMVREFEEEVKRYTGAKFAIACTSATTGLELALRVYSIGEGDEVIIPDFTHPATALVIQSVGATPVLVDVEISSRNTTADWIESAITENTKVVMPVSLFGNPLEMDEIIALAESRNLHLIEDSACSLGSVYKRRMVGSLADASVFSFHPRKILATGDGGLICTESEEVYELLKSMKHFGVGKRGGKSAFVRWGTNYRMSDILGAVALSQVRRLEESIKIRQSLASNYNSMFEDISEVSLPFVSAYSQSNYQTYTVYLHSGNRDEVIRYMGEHNIEVTIGTYALHTQPHFNSLRRSTKLTNSLALADNLLALPLHAKLSEPDQIRVVETLKAAL